MTVMGPPESSRIIPWPHTQSYLQGPFAVEGHVFVGSGDEVVGTFRGPLVTP